MGNTFARRHPAEGMSLQLCCGTRSWVLLFPRDKAVFLLTGSQIFIWQPFVKRLALFWSPVFLICSSRPWLLTSEAKRRGLISVGDLMVAKGGEIPGVGLGKDRAAWQSEIPTSAVVTCRKDAEPCATACLPQLCFYTRRCLRRPCCSGACARLGQAAALPAPLCSARDC